MKLYVWKHGLWNGEHIDMYKVIGKQVYHYSFHGEPHWIKSEKSMNSLIEVDDVIKNKLCSTNLEEFNRFVKEKFYNEVLNQEIK